MYFIYLMIIKKLCSGEESAKDNWLFCQKFPSTLYKLVKFYCFLKNLDKITDSTKSFVGMAALIQREQYLPWYYLIASFLLASVSQGCDIEVRLRSNTNKPFQFHVSAQSAGYWSDRVTVIGKTIERSPLLGGNINYHVFHVSFFSDFHWKLQIWWSRHHFP